MSAYSDAILSTPNLVAYYRFEELTDTFAADSSGNNNNGTYGNSYYYLNNPGAYPNLGKSLRVSYFGNITVPDNPTLQISGDISMEVWATFSAIDRDYGLINKNMDAYPYTGFGLSTAGQKLQAWFGSGWVVSTIPISASWHHYVVTLNGTTVRFYLDGNLHDTLVTATPNFTNNVPLIIGYPNISSEMTIDEVAIYKRGLIASEVKAHYTAALPVMSIPSSVLQFL